MSRLLLVENDEDMRLSFTTMFEKEGHQVFGVNSAEMALDAFRMEDFDLVITNLLLPGVDGAELCRMIRTGKKSAQIPVVLVSCVKERMGMEITASDSHWAPFTCVIDKTMPPTVLLDTVRELLK